MNLYEKLNGLGLALPAPPGKGGLYSPYRLIAEKYLFISGCGPALGGDKPEGRLKADYTIEEGKEFAARCMLNVLSVVQSAVGDLNRVRPVKVLTIVAGANDFFDQPRVADGGCRLLLELFGEESLPSRSAVGVSALAGNIPVETEALFEIID